MNLRRILYFLVSIVFILVFDAFGVEAGWSRPDRAITANSFTIHVRRDTTLGLLWGGPHMVGISSIIWGYGEPGTVLSITLTSLTGETVNRQVTIDSEYNYAVSVDRNIQAGDHIVVTDGLVSRELTVPDLGYEVDPVRRVITGRAPANIVSTESGSPHSLVIQFDDGSRLMYRPVTTGLDGSFLSDFSSENHLAGLMGTLAYTTAEGDRIFQPLFTADPVVRGRLDDWSADVIIGQSSFSEIVPNHVESNLLFNPGGVWVDRNSSPNRVYVYDGGNSRVLGFAGIGTCQSGARANQACSADADCPASACNIQLDRSADIVLGQPSFNTATCNGDSAYQSFPDPAYGSSATLCGLREEQLSITEGGSGAGMASDSQGNLYVPDFFNNRVLRYNDPLESDALADEVWGQADMSGIHCNRGAVSTPNASSLCLAPPPSIGDTIAGVALDLSGNLWVADNENNRVLRFPYAAQLGRPAPQADLVLGQADFATRIPGTGLDQMHKPAAIAVDDQGVVYVGDSLNNRVLVYQPPFKNGEPASVVISNNAYQIPSGLAIDRAGRLWVNYQGGYIVRYNHFSPDKVINRPWHAFGGISLDQDDNLWITISDSHQEGRVYWAPDHQLSDPFLPKNVQGSFNKLQDTDLGPSPFDLEVAAGQLIVSDGARLLFWDNVWNLASGQPADGVVGSPPYGHYFTRMRADPFGRLWVMRGYGWVEMYRLPLKTGAAPELTLPQSFPVLGGGILSSTEFIVLSGIDHDARCDCLWLVDEGSHRVFRVRDVTSSPVVDILLGQESLTETGCNHGLGDQHPSQNSLCNPGALTLDPAGNLFVSDHNLEFDGNYRLMVWNAALLPANPDKLLIGIPASQVIGRGGDFNRPGCPSLLADPMCGPFEAAFDSQGTMVAGFNGYLGPRSPLVYKDPLVNPMPIDAISDFHSMAISLRFDPFDNLYVVDLNRGRVLIYHRQAVTTYALTGMVKNASGLPVGGVSLETRGYASSGKSGPDGAYVLEGLIAGEYTIVPTKPGCTFSTASQTLNLSQDHSLTDFTAYCNQTLYIPFVFR